MKVSTYSSRVAVAAVTLLLGGGRGVSNAFLTRSSTTCAQLTRPTTTKYPFDVRLQATLSVSGDSSGGEQPPQDKTTSSSSSSSSSSSPLAEQQPKDDTHTKAVSVTTTTTTTTNNNNKKTWKELRQEGGLLTINTPIGALNPFALYYGLLSLALGLPWLVSLKACQFLYWITRGRLDQKRRLPVFFSHVWGVLVLRLSRSYPEILGKDKLQAFFNNTAPQPRPAMFVANHCSWMDIPFLGATVGWRNYKLVSKKELGRVPILGSAIQIGGNIMVDRTDRRSQLRTLKQGINYLKKEGIHLCTFPEGTRSRTGRLLPFKNGAFKMAHKAGAPIIPISIIASHKVMPTGWMFSMKPSHGTAKVIVHDPIESEGKTEDELAAAVRASLISGLPAEQQPLLN